MTVRSVVTAVGDGAPYGTTARARSRSTGAPRAALALLAALALGGPGAAGAQLVIEPGQDGFQTTPGSRAVLPVPLPEGFFGAKGPFLSDPIDAGRVLLVGPGPNLVALPVVTTFLTGPGCHTGSVNHHCYEQRRIVFVPIYDTVVERGGTQLGFVGDAQPVPIQLVHLSLQTVDPLVVTYGGGLAPPSLFDVFVSLDGVQPVGSLLLHQLALGGGMMDTVLPVHFRLDFRGRNAADPAAPALRGLQDVLQSRGNPFLVQAIPEPSSLALLSLGVGAAALWLRARRGPARG